MDCRASDAAGELAAALVNALTGTAAYGRPFTPPVGRDRARAATEVIRTLAADTAEIDCPEADRLAASAETLRRVFALFADDPPAAARELNRLLCGTQVSPLLMPAGHGWRVDYAGAAGGIADRWAGAAGWGLAESFGDDRTRLGICAAPSCDRVFFDLSRNGSRRFCGNSCKTRVKVANFRRRQRDAAKSA